jgi:hypothetical protein
MKKTFLIPILTLLFLSLVSISDASPFPDDIIIFMEEGGDLKEGITVKLYKLNCGGDILVDVATTDSYGSITWRGLEQNSMYFVLPETPGYSFVPAGAWVVAGNWYVPSYFTAFYD